jgi:acyltransferase
VRDNEGVGETSSRSGAIDGVRVLGIVAVVAGHTLNTSLVRPLFFTWHVPLFFFLAGYFWSNRRSVKEEFSKRVGTLGLPYVSWMLLIAVPFILLDATLEKFSIGRLLGPLYNGEQSAMPYTTFWFVSALFFTVIFFRLLGRLPPVVIWAVGVAGSLLGYVAGNTLAQTPLSIGSAFPCLIFVLLGTFAAKVRSRIVKPALLGIVLLALSVALIATGIDSPLDIKVGNFGTPVISVLVAAAISFALVLLAEVTFSHLPKSVSGSATQLAYAGFTVVLVHPLILWLMLKFFPAVPDWTIFALALTVPWLVGMLSIRTAASRWLTGTKRLKSTRAIT